MRHVAAFCCVFSFLSLSGVLDAQLIRSGPVGGGGFQLGPAGGGFSGGPGNSGFNGVGNNPLNGLGLKGTLPDIDPAPVIQHDLSGQAATTNQTYGTSRQTTSESDQNQSQHLTAAIPAADLSLADSTNHQMNKYVHPGGPSEEEDSDDDDSEEGSRWWLWLLIALIVVGVVVKKRR